MRRFKNILYTAAATLLIGSSCTDLTELNLNPAATSSMDPNLQLSYVQHYEACYKRTYSIFMIYPGGWNNHFTAYSGMVNYGSKGVFNATYSYRLWTEFYPNVIKNVMDMYMRSEEGTNIHAASRVMKVEAFMRLTDVYGDIPYSESGTSAMTGILAPKYDRQEDIYNSFFEELDAAVKEFNTEGDALTYDLYFGGDITKWIRYANSLRLRAAMRLIKINPEKAKQEAEAAVAGGIMTSNADNVFTVHENNRDNMLGGNAFGNFVQLYQNSFYVSEELRDALGGGTANEDPRLRLVAGIYLEDNYVDAAENTSATDITQLVYDYYDQTYPAVPAQCARSIGSDCTHEPITLSTIKLNIGGVEKSVTQNYQRLRPSLLVARADSPYIKMSYGEAILLQAEAKVRYGIGTESAESLYRKAVEAGILQFSIYGEEGTVAESVAKAYADSLPFSEADALELINTQLWLSYMFNPFEAWANTRRTNGLPERYAKYYNYYPTVNTTDGQLPRRLAYPATEQTRNKANYEEAISRLDGGDVWTSRVWWDCE